MRLVSGLAQNRFRIRLYVAYSRSSIGDPDFWEILKGGILLLGGRDYKGTLPQLQLENRDPVVQV